MPSDEPINIEVLRSVLEYLNVGVYLTDRDRQILLWNSKAAEITGFSESEVVGRACHEGILVHEDKDGHQLCHSELCPLHRAIMVERGSREPILVFAQRADGSRVAVNVNVAPLRDAGGRVVGGVEVFQDESARMHDLELAQRIQLRALPEKLLQPPGFRIDARYYPHELVGGDFYDVREAGPGRYGVLMADVAGHGVSAALYTMCLKSLLPALGPVAEDPAAFLAGLNRELNRFVIEESFASAAYLVLDARARKVRCSLAGHPPPLLFRPGRPVALLEGAGFPLGIVPDGEFEAGETALETGDLVLLYTDGATEVVNKGGRELRAEGLAALVEEERARGGDGLLERVYLRIRELSRDIVLADDFCLLSIEACEPAGNDGPGQGRRERAR